MRAVSNSKVGGILLARIDASNIRTKSLRSRNPKNMVSATMQGLMSLRNVDEIAAKRGKSVREIIG